MIEYAREHGMRSFEFLGGEDSWKLGWTSEVRERQLFQAFAPTPAGLAEWALDAYARLIWESVTRSVAALARFWRNHLRPHTLRRRRCAIFDPSVPTE